MDFDGTLVDSIRAYAWVWSYSITSLNHDISSEQVVKTFKDCGGLLMEEMKKKMLETFHLEDKVIEAKKLRDEAISKIPLDSYEIKNTGDLLKKLKALDFDLVVHSNGDRAKMIPISDYLGYTNYFSEITFGNEFGISKPDPAMLFDLMKRKGYKAEELIYWGDNDVDKQYAENAGIDYIITDTSFPRKILFNIFTNNSNLKSND